MLGQTGAKWVYAHLQQLACLAFFYRNREYADEFRDKVATLKCRMQTRPQDKCCQRTINKRHKRKMNLFLFEAKQIWNHEHKFPYDQATIHKRRSNYLDLFVLQWWGLPTRSHNPDNPLRDLLCREHCYLCFPCCLHCLCCYYWKRTRNLMPHFC